jgi:hypothetical protein
MNCPCDRFEFPPRLYIAAGLPHLPRQIASFPEFRRAILHDIGGNPALKDWRGRQPDDFGVMLIEMWAYVCDAIAFYDKVFADETYVRTALRRESLSALIALLGYRPRPAVASMVDLVALAEGRRAVTLPAGTAFRSEAFDGHPPQVFELTEEAVIHPLSNQWMLQPRRPSTFGPLALSRNFLLCASGSVMAKKDDVVLVRIGTAAFPRIVQQVSEHDGADGARYTRVALDSPFNLPANTPVSNVRLMKPSLTAGLWPHDFDLSGPFSLGGGLVVVPGGSTLKPYAHLDAVYRAVHAEQDVVFGVKNILSARRILGTAQSPRTVTPASSTSFKDAANNTITVPISKTTTPVTKLTLDFHLDSLLGITAGSPGGSGGPFASADVSDIVVHLGFIAAGTVTVEASTTLADNDPLRVPLPVEKPIDADPPGRFQLEDRNQTGAAVDGSLDYSSGSLALGQNSGWDPALTGPVRLFGNVITATRGETVRDELLGFGDATQASQTFNLKKSPLTYLPAPGTDNGVAAALKVFVDGVLWNEVRSFFNVPATAHAYIVRQNDDGESLVTFGDGVRASRLSSGARVTAWYRFGAEAAKPPAGGIHQIARPAKGLSSIRNPVAARGGADAEPPEQLRRYAPRSALLLRRAVSLADLEAAAAAADGVRNVRAEWHWNPIRQTPVAQIFYVGDPAIRSLLLQRLHGLTEPGTQIDVAAAVAVPATLAIQVAIDPAHLEPRVLAEVRARLMDPIAGLLSPDRIGIGLALFRSRICEFVCGVPGAATVADLQLNHAPFANWGVSAGTGRYFDFEQGELLLNGRNQ